MSPKVTAAVGRGGQVGAHPAAVDEGDLRPRPARRGELGIGDEIAGAALAVVVGLALGDAGEPPDDARRLGPRGGDVAVDECLGRGIGGEGRNDRAGLDRAIAFALDDDIVGAARDEPARRVDRQPRSVIIVP